MNSRRARDNSSEWGVRTSAESIWKPRSKVWPLRSWHSDRAGTPCSMFSSREALVKGRLRRL
ncbi:hypothetical protein D3C84_1157920 [compost metagenome]